MLKHYCFKLKTRFVTRFHVKTLKRVCKTRFLGHPRGLIYFLKERYVMVSCPSTYMVHTPRYVPKTLQNVRSNTVLHGGISVRSGLTPSYIGQIRSNPGVKRSDAVRPRGYNGQFRPYGGNDTHMKDTTTLFYFDRSRNHFSRLTESSLSTCPGLLLSQLT